MTTLVPEIAAMPDGLTLDGELVALDAAGRPDQPRLCQRSGPSASPTR
jgi:ATP-dependent DNA ligase